MEAILQFRGFIFNSFPSPGSLGWWYGISEWETNICSKNFERVVKRDSVRTIYSNGPSARWVGPVWLDELSSKWEGRRVYGSAHLLDCSSRSREKMLNYYHYSRSWRKGATYIEFLVVYVFHVWCLPLVDKRRVTGSTSHRNHPWTGVSRGRMQHFR